MRAKKSLAIKMTQAIKLTTDQIRLISLFQKITKTTARDCLDDENQNKIIFVVNEGKMGLAIGKGGSNIRQLQEELGGISISVKTFEEMPESMERPNPYWEDVQDRRSRSSRAWEHSGKSQRRKARNCLLYTSPSPRD